MTRHIIYILAVYAALFALAGCAPSPNKAFKTRLATADTLADRSPASAAALLRPMEKDLQQQSKFVQMSYQLAKLRCLTAPQPTDSVLTMARYFTSHGNTRHRLQAYRLATATLTAHGRHNEALRWADKACRTADSDDSTADTIKATLHLTKARLLALSPMTTAYAYNELKQAAAYTQSASDTQLAAHIAHDLQTVSQQLKLQPHSVLAFTAMQLSDGAKSHNRPIRPAILLFIFITLLLLNAVIVLYALFKKKSNALFIADIRSRLYAAQIQNEIEPLKKLVQRQRQMLQEQKDTNTDRFKTITEQQWQLERLSEHVRSLDSEETIKRNTEAQQQLLAAPIVAVLHEMAAHPMRCQFPSETQWGDLATTIEQAWPDFYPTMNLSSTLRTEEYRVCLLIKADFKMSEICYLLDISNSKLTNLRARLHTKVFGKKGGAKDFDRALRVINTKEHSQT